MTDQIIKLPSENALKSKLLSSGFEGIVYESDLIKNIADKKLSTSAINNQITHTILHYYRNRPDNTINVLCKKR